MNITIMQLRRSTLVEKIIDARAKKNIDDNNFSRKKEHTILCLIKL